MAKLDKKSARIIFIIAMAIFVMAIVSFVLYLVFRDDECDPEKNGYTKKGKPSDKCRVVNPITTNAPPPSGCTNWIPDTSFPLKKCNWGSRIKAVQSAIGFTGTDVDGRWGPMTESAVVAKIGKNQIDEADYKKLVDPPSTTGQQNKGAYAKYDNTIIRDKNMSEKRKASKNEWLGLVTGVDSSGNYYEINGDEYVLKSFTYLVG